MNVLFTQNPGIGGLDELTPAEEIFVMNLSGLSYTIGDTLFYNGTNLVSGNKDISKTITYNGDGTLDVITDSRGTKTMSYSSGVLSSITGTGYYKNKSFTYSSGKLTNITVS